MSVLASLLCYTAAARGERIAGLDGVSPSSTFEVSAITPLPLAGWTAVEGAARIFDVDGGNGVIIAEGAFDPFVAQYVPETPVPPLPNTRYTLRFDMGFVAGNPGGSAEYRFQLGTVTGGVFTALGEPATGVVYHQGNIFAGAVSGSAELVVDTGESVSGESLAVRWELVGYEGGSDFFGFDNVILDAQPVPGPDLTPPAPVSVGALAGQSVGIRFDEPLDPVSAATPGNYSISGGATVTAAEPGPDGMSVRLEVAGLTGPEFTVTVNGVKDVAGNAVANARIDGVVQNIRGEDIGFPLEIGSTFSDAPDVLRVAGGGQDVWFGADSFHFASQERTGDFDVRVRVAEFGPANAGPYAKALLMVRESVDPGSRHVSVTVYPSARNWTAYLRAEEWGESSMMGGAPSVVWPDGANYPNIWLRLKRAGETFITYGSTDGEAWTQIGDPHTPEVPYPQTVLLGVGVTSTGEQFGNVAPLATAVFTDFGDFTLDNVEVAFTRQPESVTVLEHNVAVFTAGVEVTGTAPQNLVYQWLKNGEVIPGAAGLTYSTPVTREDNGARYQLKVSISDTEFKLSDEAVLTVTPDNEPPAIVVVRSPDAFSISVGFSERLDPDSAQNTGNYLLTGGTVEEAFLMENGQDVVLRVGNLAAGYELRVAGVADLSGNVLNSGPVAGAPGPWTIEDIDYPLTPGWTFSPGEGSFNVVAAGRDIWGPWDGFHFIHRPQTGDFDVRVRISRLDLTHMSARGGLMAREELEPGGRNFFVGTYSAAGDNHWVSTVRDERDVDTIFAPGNSYVTRDSSFAFPNAWLRLTRTGNTFIAWHGANGEDWTQIGDPYEPDPPYPATIHLGMATTSISDFVATTAHYRDFSVVGSAPEPERPELEIIRDGQNVRISWPASAGDYTLRSTTDPAAPEWSPVTEQPALVNGRYQVVVPVENGRRFFRLQK